MKNLPLFLLATLLLAACAGNPATGGAAANDRYWLKPEYGSVRSDTASLLHYATYARGLGAAEREREIERLRAVYGRDKSEFHRLQYVLALSTPTASVAERRQAVQLLDAAPEGKKDSELTALANLLSTQLQAQLQTQKRSDELERRADAAEKKLDAVKDIERSLLQREKGK